MHATQRAEVLLSRSNVPSGPGRLNHLSAYVGNEPINRVEPSGAIVVNLTTVALGAEIRAMGKRNQYGVSNPNFTLADGGGPH